MDNNVLDNNVNILCKQMLVIVGSIFTSTTDTNVCILLTTISADSFNIV